MVRARFGAKQSIADKTERKRATLTNIPVASTRMKLPQEEPDEEESPRDVIRRIAEARGQGLNGVR